MNRTFRKSRRPGFTLVEMLVVLAIVAIVLLVAWPSMGRLVRENRLHGEATRLRLAIGLARAEAVSRNRPVSLCPSRYAVTGRLACEGDFRDGWIVFSNPTREPAPDARDINLVQAFEALPAGYRLTNRAGDRPVSTTLTYRPGGSTGRNLTLKLCPPPGARSKPWRVVINRVGRARLTRDWGTC